MHTSLHHPDVYNNYIWYAAYDAVEKTIILQMPKVNVSSQEFFILGYYKVSDRTEQFPLSSLSIT